MCSEYGIQGHQIQERTVLVGYACALHSTEGNLLWSQDPSKVQPLGQSDSEPSLRNGNTLTGVKITSKIALRALEEARLKEISDGDSSTEIQDESIGETASSNTTLDHESWQETKRAGDPSVIVYSYLDDLRSRLRNPRRYIDSLKDLEEIVWTNSTISIYGSGKSQSNLDVTPEPKSNQKFIPYPSIPFDLLEVLPNRLSDDPFGKDPTNTSDEEINLICQSTTDETTSQHLNSIRVCRNVIVKTFLNLKLLQQSNYTFGCFSILLLDRRRNNVATMIYIENTDFIALIYEIEYILRDCASLVLHVDSSKTRLNIDARLEFLTTDMVKQYCRTILQMDNKGSSSSVVGVVDTLRLLVHTLDFAVASYAGAHCSDFIFETLGMKEPIDILSPFEDSLNKRIEATVIFQRGKLQCLDPFHLGKPVWIFCPGHDKAPLPLYLSTTMDAFNDVWGPVWKAKDPFNPKEYTAYVVGNGSIFRWKHDESISPLLDNEIFCHWISNEEYEGGMITSGRIDGRFNGKEKLLIGAPSQTPPTGKQHFIVNPNCSRTISDARSHLRGASRLCILGATKPYHYNDSNQYQIQIGYSGVNASATKQYKRVPGQSLKNIFIELWAMEPNIRDPRLLADLHGVEVSLCTCNSQRVSLLHILQLKCMQSLLRDFQWDEDHYQEAYFQTLADLLYPLRMLEPKFKSKFEQAVMLCLKTLSKTGVDTKENLSVFLSSKCTPKPEIATLVAKEHNWIGMLKDTTTECTMAVFGDHCVEFNHPDGVSCGQDGHSVLRSAIIPNSSIKPSLPLTRLQSISTHENNEWTFEWDISSLELGKCFWLGERGNLSLKSHLGDGILLMEWRASALKTAIRIMMGQEQVHREYTEIDHSKEGMARLIRPIPIFIISDRNRGSFSTKRLI